MLMLPGLLAGALPLLLGAEPEVIVTVKGEIPASELGKTLSHEHVLCDFGGAEKVRRADADEVIALMAPRLRQARERGFTGFADATPAYIGRDVRLLRRLAEAEGLHILTNTGYYGAARDKFLPSHAFSESADELAARWTAEFRDGIDGSGIRPGFIKIGVDGGPLSPVDRKIVVAAARAHLRTGLTIACHTGEETAALETLQAVRSEKVAPEALIIVHADGIPSAETHLRLAEAGAWIEYDAIGGRPIEEHVKLIQDLNLRGKLDRLLLSHDAGWYSLGEPGGGKEKVRPFTVIEDKLIPALRKAGFTEDERKKLLVENPRQAFTLRVRRVRE